MKPIGIIGGVGPFAGIDLTQKILTQTAAKKDQEHIPVVLHSFPHQIPDRNAFVVGQSHDNPTGPLLNILESLACAGASVVGIACNTAHAPIIFEPLKMRAAKLGINLLNMVDETIQFVKQNYPEIQRLGLVGTDGTYQSRTYEVAFARVGIDLILPSSTVQTEAIHQAIYDPVWGIKAACWPVSRQAKQMLGRGIMHLKEKNVDAVLLACTELPLAVDTNVLCGLKEIDPTLVLARALIHHAAGSSSLIPLTTSF